MIEDDTIKLLRQCDSGIKMGITAIDDVMEHACDENLRKYLSDCKEKHEELKARLQSFLKDHHDEGKNPNPMAKSMSSVKTNIRLALNPSDQVIADLITDGCNMGIKSLSRYLNQYKAASEESKDIAKDLIKLEENLSQNMRSYL